ncbi:bifunctional [glutamine synthetase] adenylyltransferase/[glutamine synthetase]-adenylyl-L-tyrosine phosphorylase [Methyloraptor flagellatus]|uniref:Bifunctional glutamine synthetase adenylyltransferase/adenylyl-removing enzyme n=1 Tax=Methyloraptor flagellatus TaxID=3162530 RepID=A0AAU7X799_9HYPH
MAVDRLSGSTATAALVDRLQRTITPKDRKAARAAFERVAERATGDAAGPWKALIDGDERVRPFLEGVFGSSPYLTSLAAADPLRVVRLLGEDPAATLDRLVAAPKTWAPDIDERDLMRRLRLLKQEAALAIAFADIGRVWTTLDVTDALTRIGDATLGAAVDFALREAAGRGKLELADPAEPSKASGYILLAMGKYGAHELNYSSDIDLIVLFDRDTARLADPDEATDLFVKITKRMVRIMNERTAEGYVFRVDLRLRPDPGATPIAMSLAAALQYYESMGQNWERAALIKARPAAGDLEAGWSFIREIAPFIWRKYFDFAAIQDVHSIKRQIHAHKGHGEIAIDGHNVKLGRGGIREVEFFVQTQQLIAGGRNPALRGRATLAMLDELVAHHWIEPQVRDDLAEAYVFLRDVEHRIQMVADEQTHVLPDDHDGVERIGRMMGFKSYKDFAAALRQRFETVQSHYARLFENAPELSSGTGNLVFTGDDDDPDTIETLVRLGFKNPSAVTAAIRAWHFGRYPATRSTVARERLTELTPILLEALAATDNADAAFLGFDRLVSRLPTGIQLFSILATNRPMLNLIAAILGAAPKLADTISRRPRVIDALLDPAFFDHLPSEAELDARLKLSLGEARGYEDLLDRARIFGQEQMVLIGVRILTGTVSVAQGGLAYATLAGVLVRNILAAVEAEIARVHGRMPSGRAVVVAMGKLGGREMTAASDLDLMLLYDFEDPEEMSDGDKPLMGAQYYARLTQRLIAALSAPTAEGIVYSVDFRLRPSGNKGPVATRLSSFEAYQTTEAWTWEHMALTRARVIAGPADFAARVETAIRDVLVRPRDRDKLRADVVEMRRMIEAEKGTKDPWDIKQVAGGLVDVEFIAQYLMLRHGAEAPATLSTNTAQALNRLADAGLLDRADAEILLPAVRLYHGLTQALRLAFDGAFAPKQAPRGLVDLLIRVGEMPDLNRLEAELRETEHAVRAVFERVVGRVGRAR